MFLIMLTYADMKNKAAAGEITREEVKHVATLSRLSLDEKDVARFQEQLSRILDYIAQLNEVDIDGVEPTTHTVSSLKNVFREDRLKPSLPVEEALKNAPERHQDFFKVPRVI
jgi:aspartyl-tRNA(Asn)/glutamyl-tRNA(Gln) amidotransferase subunit C